MNKIALKNRRFVNNLVVKGMSQADAYAQANGDKVTTPSHSSSGSRMLKTANVQELIKRQRQRYVRDAKRAYDEQWKLAGEITTPPNVKMGFYKDIQDRAGLGAIDLHVTEITHKFEELNMTKNELLNLITEPEKLVDDGRLNK